MQAQKALFVSFEGIDGAGKSTHINSLKNAFEAQGQSVVLTREPGGTLLAEQLRHLILNQAMDPLVESLLVFAARRDHLNNVIVPALMAGHVVLCDRFTDATFAYQGAGRGFNLSLLNQLENWVQSVNSWPDLAAKNSISSDLALTTILQPDITVWFDLPPAEAAKRLASARVPDRFESQPQAFFEAVAQGYFKRFEADPHRFIRINALQTIEQVGADLFAALHLRSILKS